MRRTLLTGALLAVMAGLWVLPAAFLLHPLPRDSAQLVVEVAAMRPALLQVAAATDESRSSGDLEPLKAAIAELEDLWRRIATRTSVALGDDGSALIASLSQSSVALTTAALSYAEGTADTGSGGMAFSVSNRTVDEILDELAARAERTSLQAETRREMALITTVLAALGSVLGAGLLWWRSARLARSHDWAVTELRRVDRDLPVVVLETGAGGRIVSARGPTGTVLGYDAHDLAGRALAEFVDEMTPLEAVQPGRDTRADLDWRDPEGTLRRVRMVARGIAGVSGGLHGVMYHRNTEGREDRGRRDAEERFRTVIDTAQNGMMVVTNDGRVTLYNKALARLLGYANGDLNRVEIRQLVAADEVDYVMTLFGSRMWSDFAPVPHEARLVRRDGERVDVELSISAYRERGQHTGVLVEVRDLTETFRAAATIRRMAEYDGLTGLPNRELFGRYAERAIAEAKRAGAGAAILAIDLDRFKVVNDTLGHASGDRLLRAIAERLQREAPAGASVARFGGDEYLILLPDLRQASQAERLAGRIVEVLGQPFHHDGRELRVSASIGISLYPEHDDSPEALVQHAVAAMYVAKQAGGRGARFYDPGVEAASAVRLAIEEEMPRAIEQGELRLLYQPQVEIASGQIVAVEALIRWQHPERGLLVPDDFVPLLEETGQIVEVGRWVIRQACADLRSRDDAGLAPVRVAINCSARQLEDPSLLSTITEALAEHGLAPDRLEVELTETTATLNDAAAQDLLRELRAMGVRAALDDFGTGHSSLGRLREFPLDTLKIDRSFVSTLGSGASDLAIVKSVIAVARAMDLTVVAEGVESELQAHVLRSLGCDLAQGYLYARPLEDARLRQILQDGATIGRLVA